MLDPSAVDTIDLDVNELDTMSITCGFEVTGPFLLGTSKSVGLVCTEQSGTISRFDPAITLIFVADDTEPGGVIVPQL